MKHLVLEALDLVLWIRRYVIFFLDFPKLIESGSLVSSLGKLIKILFFCSHLYQIINNCPMNIKPHNLFIILIFFVPFMKNPLIVCFQKYKRFDFLCLLYLFLFSFRYRAFALFLFSFRLFLSQFFCGSYCNVLGVVKEKMHLCLFFTKGQRINQTACLEAFLNYDQIRPRI